MNPKRLIVFDSSELFRKGLLSLLQQVIGGFIYDFDPKEAEQIRSKFFISDKPDLHIVNFDKGNVDDELVMKTLRSIWPESKILVLSNSSEPDNIISALKLGANGYLSKNSSLEELKNGINTILERGFFINEYVTGQILSALRNDATPTLDLNGREIEFINHCATEMGYQEIANLMDVSPRTIDNYRAGLFAKLNITTRTGLVVYGIKHNLIKI